MPYIIPQTNNYFGLMPVVSAGSQIQVNPYVVSSSEAADINAGDLLMFTTMDTVRSVSGITNVGSPTSSQAYAGVAAHTLLAGTGSTAALYNSNTSKLLLVYDDPNQLFVICDTTSGVIGALTGGFKNYVILGTGCVGSTGAFAAGTVNSRSNMALSGVTSTAAGSFKVMYMHPIENNSFSTAGAATAGSAVNVRKWIGKIVTQAQTQSTQLTAMVNTTS
jgi:hypothetical protein